MDPATKDELRTRLAAYLLADKAMDEASEARQRAEAAECEARTAMQSAAAAVREITGGASLRVLKDGQLVSLSHHWMGRDNDFINLDAPTP